MSSITEWKGQTKESVNLKIGQYKLPSLNNKEKTDWRGGAVGRMNRTSGSYRTVTVVVIVMSSESWTERRKTVGLKNYSSKYGFNLPKFGKRHKPTDSRS